jgi:chromosome segregation ATPase
VGQVTRLEEAGREKDKRIAELEYQLIELRSEVLAKERENVALTAEVAVLKEKIAWLTERLNYYERGGGVGGVAAGGGDGS